MEKLNVEKIQQHDDPRQILDSPNKQPMSIDEIDRIPKEIDELEKIEVKIKIDYGDLRELNNIVKKNYGENNISLNGYICQIIREATRKIILLDHVGSLSFAGSFPRKDVLEKLHSISIEFESWPEYPKFKRNHLEAILKKIIGYKDPRTFKKYIDCIKTFVETKTSKQIIFYGDYDISGFKKIVEEGLNQHDNKEINNVNS